MTRFVSCCLTLTLALPLSAADWPQFRGPAASGVADDQKPPVKFGQKENLAWKVPVPPGASSPIVVGDRLFLTAFENDKLYTICYSATDGKELWKVQAPAEKIEPFLKGEGSPAASTPASDGKRVVVYFGSCGLLCYNLDGKEQWRFLLPMAETKPGFGTGTSPVIADGLALLLRDLHTDSALYAIDLATGSEKWKAPRPKAKTGYNSPAVWPVGGRKVVVAPGTVSLTGYDLKTGKALWTHGRFPVASCATPVLAGDVLVFMAWSPAGPDTKMPGFAETLKEAGEEKLGHLTKAGAEKAHMREMFDFVDANNDGKVTAEEWGGLIKFMKQGENRGVALKPGAKAEVAWEYSKNLPYVPSPLVYRDRLYILRDGPQLTCLDAKTGKPVYEAERFKGGAKYYASPVAANGHIYAASLDGTVAVIAAGEDKPDAVFSVKLEEGIRATPALAYDTLYVRSDKFLYAFRTK
jgi:outer membrane protein assembly factor BamB